MLIGPTHFFERIGTDEERPKDRHFYYRLCRWRLDFEMARARIAGDYELIAHLNRQYETLASL